MPRHAYIWSQNQTPPEIGPHSLKKQEVTEDYVAKCVGIIASNTLISHLNVKVVDGFAGGGIYSMEGTGAIHEGSPLYLMRAMKRAEAQIKASRTKDFRLNAEFIFIEKKREIAQYLDSTLEARAPQHYPDWRKRTKIVQGAFDDHIEAILAESGPKSDSRRTIFVLDQYGYTDVPMGTIRKIFAKLKNAEVILTFAVDWLLDYMKDAPPFRKALSRTGLEVDVDELCDLLKSDSANGLARIQRLFHAQFHKLSGANYYTPFFIRSQKANRAFWLLHFSAHSRARDAMASLHWQKHDTFVHFGGAGFNMLGYDAREDESLTRTGSFGFDLNARALTNATLVDDIVRRIHRMPEGETFGSLFDSTTNGTPANQEIMREALGTLLREKEIQLFDGSRERAPGVIIQRGDIIRPQAAPMLPVFRRTLGRK
jgi:three-Cys-motif partner protein